MTRFQAHPRYHQEKHLTIFQEYLAENVASKECTSFWPVDIVLYSIWPIFPLIQEITKANNLTEIQEYSRENVASRAYTGLF